MARWLNDAAISQSEAATRFAMDRLAGMRPLEAVRTVLDAITSWDTVLSDADVCWLAQKVAERCDETHASPAN